MKFLTMSPATKVRLEMQKAKRDREKEQEFEVSKRMKVVAMKVRVEAGFNNKGILQQIMHLIDDIIVCVFERVAKRKKKTGEVVFVRHIEVVDITISASVKPVPFNPKLGTRVRKLSWKVDRIPALFMFLHPAIFDKCPYKTASHVGCSRPAVLNSLTNEDLKPLQKRARISLLMMRPCFKSIWANLMVRRCTERFLMRKHGFYLRERMPLLLLSPLVRPLLLLLSPRRIRGKVMMIVM